MMTLATSADPEVRPMVSHQPCLACKVIVSLVLLAVPVQARSDVKDVTLKDLAAESQLIVVARVTKVEDGPAELQPARDEFPPVKVATALVIETWKGDKVREIRYIASPAQPCDIASADVGERVVLFLEGSKNSLYSIAWVGRGWMPIHDENDNRYATLARQVILPKGTPTMSRSRTSHIVLPSLLTGKPEHSLTFKYTKRAIELATLRKLVKGNSRSSRPASP
jgi:hypothetical protein